MTEITERLRAAIADRYVVERELGQGGMATVYLAHDVKHDRNVALKVLRPELAAVIGAERFLQEIKVTANLQHSHILPLYDSGAAEGFLFYVMPYVEGETLRTRLTSEKQLPVDEAVELTRAVAAALEHAHKQGVIHRDIKPENILLRDSDPLIADFGIALALSQAGGNRLTETGLSIGTPQYMSPEQAMGDRELDARSDVYSLAAVLYEMLTGEPPYSGTTAQAIVARVITEDPRPILLQRRTVPTHVADAVHRALNKLPADRFHTAAEFAEALTTPGAVVRPPTPVQAAPAPRSRVSRSVVAAGVLGVAALVAGAVLGRVTISSPDARVVRLRVIDSLHTGGQCCGPGLALSPDGSQIVISRLNESGQPALAIRALDGLEIRSLPGTEDASSPFFSPDGRWLGFEVGGRLRKISLAGGPPITIVEVGDEVRGASWGRNDTIVFANDDDDRLYRVGASGGAAEQISDGPAGNLHRNPALLPGERKVVFSNDPGPLADMRLVVLDLETGAVDTLQTPGTMARYAPSGHLVFTGADGSLLAQPFDPERGEPTGPAVALLDGVRLRGIDGTGEFAISQSGDLAYVPGQSAGAEELVLANASGRTNVSLPRELNLEDPAIAPDGRRVAVWRPDDSDSPETWLLDRDQGTLTRLTTEGNARRPVWTPDGRRIAYGAQVDSQPRAIYWRAADGSGTAERLLALDVPAMPQGFTPDGRTILVQAFGRPGTRADIGLFTIGDSTVRWVAESEFQERQAQLSPDGRWLAYTSDRSGSAEVYVRSASGSGGRYQISTGGGHSPKWSPDGSTLYYGRQQSITAAALRLGDDVRVQSRTTVLQAPVDFNFGNTNYDVHPTSGELLVIVQGEGGGESGFDVHWILGWPQIVRDMETGR